MDASVWLRLRAAPALLTFLVLLVGCGGVLQTRQQLRRPYSAAARADAPRAGPPLLGGGAGGGGGGGVSARSRMEMTVARLGLYRGHGRRRARAAYAAVSAVGVMGMFAAIVGAMLGVWLDEACEDGDEEDGFSYWDDGEWDLDGDLGWEREEHYAGMREVGGLLYSS
jgi:hypothetical protein